MFETEQLPLIRDLARFYLKQTATDYNFESVKNTEEVRLAIGLCAQIGSDKPNLSIRATFNTIFKHYAQQLVPRSLYIQGMLTPGVTKQKAFAAELKLAEMSATYNSPDYVLEENYEFDNALISHLAHLDYLTEVIFNLESAGINRAAQLSDPGAMLLQHALYLEEEITTLLNNGLDTRCSYVTSLVNCYWRTIREFVVNEINLTHSNREPDLRIARAKKFAHYIDGANNVPSDSNAAHSSLTLLRGFKNRAVTMVVNYNIFRAEWTAVIETPLQQRNNLLKCYALVKSIHSNCFDLEIAQMLNLQYFAAELDKSALDWILSGTAEELSEICKFIVLRMPDMDQFEMNQLLKGLTQWQAHFNGMNLVKVLRCKLNLETTYLMILNKKDLLDYYDFIALTTTCSGLRATAFWSQKDLSVIRSHDMKLLERAKERLDSFAHSWYVNNDYAADYAENAFPNPRASKRYYEALHAQKVTMQNVVNFTPIDDLSFDELGQIMDGFIEEDQEEELRVQRPSTPTPQFQPIDESAQCTDGFTEQDQEEELLVPRPATPTPRF